MSKYRPFRLKKLPVSFLIEKRAVLVLSVLLLLTAAVVVVSTGIGTAYISPFEVVKVFFGQGSDTETLIVEKFRMPRVLIGVLIGAALAVSGAILQGIIRNPLASPDIIGINSGGAVMAVLFIAVFNETLSISWLPFFAFFGAATTMVFIYFAAWKRGVSPLTLVLVGIGVAALLEAVRTVMIVFSPIYQASQAFVWITGSLHAANWNDVYTLLPWIVVFIPVLFVVARHVNIQAMGDEIAKGVGSAVQRQRFVLLFVCTALAGAAVAFGGGIGFVGLMAPHMARRIVGGSFGAVLPTSALIGATVVVVADLVGRTAFAPLDVPAGVFTATIGAPYFIYLLIKTRNA